MAVFSYKAIDGNDAPVRGTVVADTARQARDLLRGRGLEIEKVAQARRSGGEVKRAGLFQALGGLPGRLPLRRSDAGGVTTFIRELATLLSVGLPLLESMDTIIRQQRGPFRTALQRLRDRVSSGVGLADAMAEDPGLFDNLCVTITRVGESAGTLDGVLEQLADFREKSARFRNRVANALLYPAIVLLTGIGVSLFLMTFVVPNLLEALTDSGKALPLPTRIVKAGSDLLIHRWWALLLGAGLVVALGTALVSTPRGRLGWHRLQLRIPVIGELIRKQSIGRVVMVLSTLLRSGVVFEQAIKIAQRTTGNLVIRAALVRCEQAVKAGGDISASLDGDDAVFPPTAVQVFAVGQQSGRLESMLERLARDYDRQVDTGAARLVAVLEPVMIVMLAVIVGTIAFATILPILEAGDVL
jgi:type II secretory pathway component PulF